MDEFEIRDLVSEFCQELDHRICLGVRYGLYGANADNNENGVTDALFSIGDSLDKVAKAITSIQQKTLVEEQGHKI